MLHHPFSGFNLGGAPFASLWTETCHLASSHTLLLESISNLASSRWTACCELQWTLVSARETSVTQLPNVAMPKMLGGGWAPLHHIKLFAPLHRCKLPPVDICHKNWV